MTSSRDIDGGWAWVVLGASYVNILLCSGLAYAAGIFQVVFLEHFEGSVALTAWVTSLFSSLMQLAGPISSILANRWSCRASVMFGGVFITLGFFISGLANSLGLLFVTFGIVAGIGLGMIYTASTVVISFYFNKRRTLVNGIGASAGGLGIILAPQVAQILLKNFTWREALFIFAGVSAQMCVAGALMFSIPRKKGGSFGSRINVFIKRLTRFNGGGKDRDHQRHNTRFEDDCQYTIAKDGSVHLEVKMDEVSLVADEGNENYVSDQNTLQYDENVHLNTNARIGSLGGTNCANSSEFYDKISVDSHLQNVDSPSSAQYVKDTSLTLTGQGQGKTPCGDMLQYQQFQYDAGEMCKTYHESTYSSVNNISITEDQNSSEDDEIIQQHNNTTKSEIEIGSEKLETKSNNNDVVSPSLQRLPLYRNNYLLVLCLSLFISLAGCGTFNIHVPSYLKSQGLSESEVMNVLSMNGVAILFGRCLIGALANSVPGNDSLFFIIMHIAGGIFVCLMPVAGSHYQANLFIAFGVGSYAGTVYAILPTLTIRYVGLDRLTSAFGIEMVISGLGGLLSPPLAGQLVDSTGKYEYSIFVGGSLFILAGLVAMILPGMEKPTRREEIN